MKKCPDCAEEAISDLRKCRFCEFTVLLSLLSKFLSYGQ